MRLQPDTNAQSRVINFGTDREAKSVVFAITATPPLTATEVKSLSLVAEDITRVGQDTDSVTFPEPAFGVLRLSGNGKRLTFRVCLKPPADLPAGRYTGAISVEGLAKVESASVAITANAKNGKLFTWGALLALALTVLTLLYKDVTPRISALQLQDPDKDKPKGRLERKFKHAWFAFWDTVTEPSWIGPTVFALATAYGTLYALWAKNPSWGESGFAAVSALIGAALGAIGAKTIFAPNSGALQTNDAGTNGKAPDGAVVEHPPAEVTGTPAGGPAANDEPSMPPAGGDSTPPQADAAPVVKPVAPTEPPGGTPWADVSPNGADPMPRQATAIAEDEESSEAEGTTPSSPDHESGGEGDPPRGG
ncbi:hypothetical protein [Solirubrobacter ginsenosidimutans]|uniref:hypothetical protein n=1 Tax=Solirubrobacter ginsenosidimutans TaxID=490573 RepID=UPI0022CDF2B4|nr:hypothetical protein [Solirubrobacter ginsenosidimutans]